MLGSVRTTRVVLATAHCNHDTTDNRNASRATLYRMIAKGELSAYKLGTATVIRHFDLVKLVEGREPLARAFSE